MALNYKKVVEFVYQHAFVPEYTLDIAIVEGRRLRIRKAARGHLNLVLDGKSVGQIAVDGSLTLTTERELVSTTLRDFLSNALGGE